MLRFQDGKHVESFPVCIQCLPIASVFTSILRTGTGRRREWDHGMRHERRQLTCRQACVGMSNAISDLTNVACRLDGIQVDDKGNEGGVVRVVGCGENA